MAVSNQGQKHLTGELLRIAMAEDEVHRISGALSLAMAESNEEEVRRLEQEFTRAANEAKQRYEVKDNPIHQAMVHACRDGDLGRLQQLFRDADIKEGDDPVLHKSGLDWATLPAPDIGYLLEPAIANKNSDTVAFLLKTHPKADVKNDTELNAAFEHPHLETFKLLHAHQPEILRHEWMPWTNALSQACTLGAHDPTIPEYLLEHGLAESEIVGGPCDYPLGAAIISGQPLQLIQKMVLKGIRPNGWHVRYCVQWRRADVLRFLLKSTTVRISLDDAIRWLVLAQENQDDVSVALLESYMREIMVTKRPFRKKWWKFWEMSLHNKKSDSKKWWEFWK